MGGRLWAESEEGRGSRFHFTVSLGLPSPELPAGRPATPLVSAPPAPVGKVLLVGGDAATLQFLQRLLQTHRYSVVVTSAGRAADAVEIEPFGAVVMDVSAPGPDPFAAAARIRQRERGLPLPLSRLPIFALSADASPAGRERCLEAGMDACFVKPLDAVAIEAAFASVLPGRSGRIAP